MNNVNIEQLKERATFNQDVLDAYVERMKAAYEPYQSFVFSSPSEMFTGLHSLYTKGYTPCNELMSNLLPPMYYQVWCYKPEATQQAELYEVIQRARASYEKSVEEAKEQLFEALVEAEYQEEEAKAQSKAEREAQKRKDAIRSKIQKEMNT
ncbi:hypothetical protein [Pseudomonas sp.]|uniref:hypothetical protein n=1 Tax=Pseudomonas sp. TaxID=306 RepID=UPI003C747AA6